MIGSSNGGYGELKSLGPSIYKVDENNKCKIFSKDGAINQSIE